MSTVRKIAKDGSKVYEYDITLLEVIITPCLRDKIKDRAEYHGLTMSEYVRRVLRQQLKREAEEENGNEQAGKGAQTDTEGEAYQ